MILPALFEKRGKNVCATDILLGGWYNEEKIEDEKVPWMKLKSKGTFYGIQPVMAIDYDFVGINWAMRPANSAMFWVWRMTRPGPVSFVRNKPSPPKKMFPRPFTVSIS